MGRLVWTENRDGWSSGRYRIELAAPQLWVLSLLPKHVDGTPINAAYGFIRMLARLIGDHDPAYVACASDEDWRPEWRVDLIPGYKSARAEPGSQQEQSEALLAPQVPAAYFLLDPQPAQLRVLHLGPANPPLERALLAQDVVAHVHVAKHRPLRVARFGRPHIWDVAGESSEPRLTLKGSHGVARGMIEWPLSESNRYSLTGNGF